MQEIKYHFSRSTGLLQDSVGVSVDLQYFTVNFLHFLRITVLLVAVLVVAAFLVVVADRT